MNQKAIFVKIKDIELDILSGAELTDDQVDFLFSCLVGDGSREVHVAALLILSEAELPIVQRLMDSFDQFSVEVRHLLLSFLATTDFVECYVFLLSIVKRYRFEEEVTIAIYSLAYTHYDFFSLVLVDLITDDDRYLKQLKRLLFMMGIERIKPILVMYPQIPHESVFRDVFGGEVIDSLK